MIVWVSMYGSKRPNNQRFEVIDFEQIGMKARIAVKSCGDGEVIIINPQDILGFEISDRPAKVLRIDFKYTGWGISASTPISSQRYMNSKKEALIAELAEVERQEQSDGDRRDDSRFEEYEEQRVKLKGQIQLLDEMITEYS